MKKNAPRHAGNKTNVQGNVMKREGRNVNKRS